LAQATLGQAHSSIHYGIGLQANDTEIEGQIR